MTPAWLPPWPVRETGYLASQWTKISIRNGPNSVSARCDWLRRIYEGRGSLADASDDKLRSAMNWCRQTTAKIYEGDPSWRGGLDIDSPEVDAVRVMLQLMLPVLVKEDADRAVAAGRAQGVLHIVPLLHIEEPGQTIDARFSRFHELNPHVYDALRTMAMDLKSRGHGKYGIAGLFEVLRWKHAMQTEGDVFKLCNDYRACYARLLMEQEPGLVGFFRLRSRTTKGASESMTNQQENENGSQG